MQYPPRPETTEAPSDDWTASNVFISKYSRVTPETLPAMSRPEVEAHVQTSLFLLHGAAAPLYFPPKGNHVPPTENLDSLTLLRLMDCVHKDPARRNEIGQRGLIGIGPFVMDTQDFASTMVAAPTGKVHVHDVMADALGAGSFATLKVMESFAQGREWLQDRIDASPSQKDRTVWGKMIAVVARAEDAFANAAQQGAIDDRTANNIVMGTEMRTRELSGGLKDWAAPVTALLESVTRAVTSPQGEARTRELDALAFTMKSVNQAYDNAKTGKDSVVEWPRDLGLGRPQDPAIAVRSLA